jgi:hypothetical protein
MAGTEVWDGYARFDMHRKTTPKVKAGRVQKKNRWERSSDD